MHDVHLLGFHELATTLGISKQNTHKRVARPDFPRPVARLACGPVWSADDIATYLERRSQQ